MTRHLSNDKTFIQRFLDDANARAVLILGRQELHGYNWITLKHDRKATGRVVPNRGRGCFQISQK